MQARPWLLALAACATLGAVCGAASAAELDLVEMDVWLDFVHAGARHLDATYRQAMGSGACVLDHDGDGWEDLLLVNALHEDAALQAAFDPRSALYRNLEGQGFARVPGVLDVSAWGMGCAAGDMDGDGDEDVAIHTWGGLQLFRNDGGTFTNVTSSLPLGYCGVQVCFGASVAFFDADGDLDLDLYATNYNEWDGTGEPAPLPIGQCNILYRNLGNGTWEDATDATGLADCGRDHLGLSIADFTGDGRQDVFVASDEDPDALYVALPNGSFVDRAPAWGVDDRRGGMGVAAGYFDDDALLDIVITHYATEGFALYRGNASGGFDDVAVPSGLHDATLQNVGWGVEWVDLDHDGDQDLVMVNGHIPGLQFDDERLGETPLVFDNDGTGGLVDVTSRWKPSLVRGVSRGLAMADFDQDGDMDFVVVDNANESARYIRASGGHGNWLQVDPAGDALGAIVEVDVGGRTLRREVVAASSYESQSTRVTHFGLGEALQADDVRVRFPDGVQRSLGPLAANQRVLVGEDGNVTLQRSAPLASLPADVEVTRGQTLQLAGDAIRAPPGSVFEFLVENSTIEGIVLEYAWDTLGEKEVRFRIRAPDGRQDEALATVHVRNAAPEPVASFPPDIGRIAPTLLDGNASHDPDGHVVAWRWLVEGVAHEGVKAQHLFATAGEVDVTLEVEDDLGARAARTFVVLVQNAAPIAVAGEDRMSNPVATLPFVDAGSSDPDGRELSWNWDFGDGATAEGRNVTHRFDSLGDHVVVMTVRDAEGATAQDSLVVRVTDDDLAPEARFETPPTADRTQTLVFDARESIDLDGTIARYRWDFGDGATAEGAYVEHRYTRLGSYTTTLLVEDEAGMTGGTTRTIDVLNLPPALPPLGILLKEGPGTWTYDAPATDTDGTLVRYAWTVQGEDAGQEPRIEATFGSYGRYALSLEVEDDDGAVTRADGDVWVHALPEARIDAPARADRVSPVRLDASGSSDEDGRIVAWRWRFPDGPAQEGPAVEHTFSAMGVQIVTLEVEDDHGFVGTSTLAVEVANLAPTVSLGGAPEIVNLHQPFTLHAAAGDADGATPTTTWSLDGAPAGAGEHITLRLRQTGDHLIEATVVDADGATASVRITVRATDVLQTRVNTTDTRYTIDRRVEGAVQVLHADGAPAVDAEVLVRVVYRPHATVGPGIVMRELSASTDARGTYEFRLEDAWPDAARPLAPRMLAPTDPCGSYEVRVYTSWLSNVGTDLTRFVVTISPAAETVCRHHALA